MANPNSYIVNRIIAPDVLNKIIKTQLDVISPNIEQLKIVRTPVFEESNNLLFLSRSPQHKLYPKEFRLTLNFEQLTEFGLALLMRPAFQALEKQRETRFSNIYDAINAYFFACIEYNRVAPENTEIELILDSDDLWVDIAKMNDCSIAYTDDGLPDNYEYRYDSPYLCQVAKYYDSRCQDTLCGWRYTVHPNSICLTPPQSWKEVPKVLNVNWYKRPLYWSMIHKGYFLSYSPNTVNKVIELGALYDLND